MSSIDSKKYLPYATVHIQLCTRENITKCNVHAIYSALIMTFT